MAQHGYQQPLVQNHEIIKNVQCPDRLHRVRALLYVCFLSRLNTAFIESLMSQGQQVLAQLKLSKSAQ